MASQFRAIAITILVITMTYVASAALADTYVKCTSHYGTSGRRRVSGTNPRCHGTSVIHNGPRIDNIPIRGSATDAAALVGSDARVEVRINAWPAPGNSVRARILQYEKFSSDDPPPPPPVQRGAAEAFVTENGRNGPLDVRTGLGDEEDPEQPACIFAKSIRVRCVTCRDGEENPDPSCDRPPQR